MKLEIKTLESFAKKIVLKKTYKKIKKVEDKKEKIHLLKHFIKSSFESKVSELRDKIKLSKKKGKEVFFISIKINLLSLKIKYFLAGYNKKEFIIVLKLIKYIEKELKEL